VLSLKKIVIKHISLNNNFKNIHKETFMKSVKLFILSASLFAISAYANDSQENASTEVKTQEATAVSTPEAAASPAEEPAIVPATNA
jgi:hypothetical protein